MAYPDVYGNIIHLTITAYPPEGASVRFVFYDTTPNSPYASDQMTVAVPPGTDPFIYNYTCTLCYTLSYKLGVSMNYAGDSSTTWLAKYDSTLGIGGFGYSKASPTFSASLRRLTSGDKYYIVAACASPAYVYRKDFVAQYPNDDVAGTLPAYPCTGYIYVVLSSADNVNVVGMKG